MLYALYCFGSQSIFVSATSSTATNPPIFPYRRLLNILSRTVKHIDF